MIDINELLTEKEELTESLKKVEEQIALYHKQGPLKFGELWCSECNCMMQIPFAVDLSVRLPGYIELDPKDYGEDNMTAEVSFNSRDISWNDTSIEAECPKCHQNRDIDSKTLPTPLQNLIDSLDEEAKCQLFKNY